MIDPEVDNPDWESGGKTHNWRNYIYQPLIDIWHTFTYTQKCAIRDNAQIEADSEEWD